MLSEHSRKQTRLAGASTSPAVEALLAKTGDMVKSRPLLQLQIAEIGIADAVVAGKSDPAKTKELAALAIKRAEEALKAAEEAKLPAVQLDQFHFLLAERKLLSGAKPEVVEQHLARLRESTDPQFRLAAQFFAASLAQRQGKLDKARKLVQPLAAERHYPNLVFQANLLIANISLATGDPSAALAALREVETAYAKLEQFSPAVKEWADQLIGGPDRITSWQIGANLGVALQAVARYQRENPGKIVPGELISGYETTAETLMKKLRPPSDGDRIARLVFAGYLNQTSRRKEAEVRLETLATDYPESIDILRNRCVLLASPTEQGAAFNPNGVAAADLVIRKFLKDYPADKAARLFNAEWLVRTDRAKRAVEYLSDPATFPNGRDAAVDRLLADALLRTGQRDEAEKILNKLPSDPVIDAVLIQAAATRESGEKQLKAALDRYENQGLFRVYEGFLRLGDGKYDEAVREFAAAVEFTQVRDAARIGLGRALLAYAGAEPSKARAEAIRLAGEMPDEPSVYLAAALASLVLEEVGSPEDKWDLTKTMYAAVNRWEAAAIKEGTQPSDVVVMKARFRFLAGDPDAAKRDAVTGLNRNPKHLPTMLLLVDLNLLPPADPTRAREFLDAATKENANDPRLPYADAAIRGAAGDWAGAVKVYEKLISDTPKGQGIYPLLVAALNAAEDKEGALKWTRTWAERFPADGRASAELIRLLSTAGNNTAAVKIADELVVAWVAEARKQATATVPPLPQADADKRADNARAAAMLAGATGFFRAGVFDEAETRAKEALKIHPANPTILMMLGDLAIARKDWDRALSMSRDMLAHDPLNGVAGNNAAWILAEMKNDPAAALVIVEEVRKARGNGRPIAPERLRPDFLDTIGVVYFKLNRSDKFPEMRTIFEAAVKRYPGDPRMNLYLAHAQAATGDKARALDTYDAAIRLAGTKNGLPDDQNKMVIDAAEAARKRLRN